LKDIEKLKKQVFQICLYNLIEIIYKYVKKEGVDDFFFWGGGGGGAEGGPKFSK
jgi:hypothetical protein